MELTAAEPRRKNLTQLYLDGEPGPKVDTEVFLLSRLKPGDELTQEELSELMERSDARRAREKALYLLEHRSHSKRELTEKIARTAASREAAQAAADRLEEIGLIDDKAFAESYARELFLRKRFGALRVRQELSRKGIDRELIDQVMAPYLEEDTGEENIALVLARRYPLWREDEKIRRRAVAALQRLGYSYGQIRAVMGQPEEME
jgi:regulatory protein